MKLLRTSLKLLLILSFTSAQAQQDEVLAVVQSIFTGMATDNGEMVRAAFTEDATMFTVYEDEEGNVQKRQGSLDKFVDAVNGEKPAPFNEPIWNEQIAIDGPLASVWVDYAFYLGNDFHHCGVDAFHLIDTNEGWKVFHLVDTRRKDDCVVPDEVKAQFE